MVGRAIRTGPIESRASYCVGASIQVEPAGSTVCMSTNDGSRRPASAPRPAGSSKYVPYGAGL